MRYPSRTQLISPGSISYSGCAQVQRVLALREVLDGKLSMRPFQITAQPGSLFQLRLVHDGLAHVKEDDPQVGAVV